MFVPLSAIAIPFRVPVRFMLYDIVIDVLTYLTSSTVIWKLKSQPDATGGSQAPATTATGVIGATQEQIDAYKAESRREIAEALNKVPGPLVPMQFGPPQLPERAKGYEFAKVCEVA
ncbi:hypothetical protein FRC11_000773 [Ceratobasidium sp. 423]|nr:hypothetical protein FRC11_000773 [Ceratobasidium sp. 423]